MKGPGAYSVCPNDPKLNHDEEGVKQCLACQRDRYIRFSYCLSVREKEHRDAGIRFFEVPTDMRAQFFGDGESAGRYRTEHAFITMDCGPTNLGSWFRDLHKKLDQVGYNIGMGRVKPARQKMTIKIQHLFRTVERDCDNISELMECEYDESREEMIFKSFPELAQTPGAGLPTEETDPERYRQFRDWAIRLREVRNDMRLGSTADEAIDRMVESAYSSVPEDRLISHPGYDPPQWVPQEWEIRQAMIHANTNSDVEDD